MAVVPIIMQMFLTDKRGLISESEDLNKSDYTFFKCRWRR
ncbi:protein of unknown function [Petrocella atlantisensis]|uniref:Uncharacterized protein n=1 Tax=Petrocella atlantisensis TaxID=2173034 RepID=A0A3P7P2L5_9FIRM|nr:protein of unknown function [Petrocella atlantisensis]